MSATRFILAVLLCGSPAILLWDNLIAQGLVAEVAAVALVITAATLRPFETGFLVSVIRRPVAIAAIPAAWMLIQALPLGLFAHPIWNSAAAALGQRITGAISVDPATTLIALGQYLSMIAVAIIAAAVAIDRQRAEWVFIPLLVATITAAVLVLVHDFVVSAAWLAGCTHDSAIDCCVLGAILAGTACIRSIELHKNRQGRQPQSAFSLPIGVSGTAVAICVAPLLISANVPMLLATAFGLSSLLCVTLIRRLDLGLFGVTGLAVTVLGVAVLLLAAHPIERGTSFTLSFASSSSLRSLAQHVLDDAPWVGTGANTFAALAPTYREISDPEPGCSAATAAATLAIELGRPMLWLIVFSAFAVVLVLLRDSLRRGRDWFHPAMAGSCTIAMLLIAFINAGLFGSTTALLFSAALGLGFAQSKSRAVK